jgi:hypothetical protein
LIVSLTIYNIKNPASKIFGKMVWTHHLQLRKRNLNHSAKSFFHYFIFNLLKKFTENCAFNKIKHWSLLI